MLTGCAASGKKEQYELGTIKAKDGSSYEYNNQTVSVVFP
jgi:hypothetical protein